ncbi:MAG: hypothetical protein R2744_06055 [Bacteroidales bacterium]
MSKIENRDRKEPFRVPDDYFESMTGKLMQSVTESGEIGRRGILRILKPHLTLAAAMVALVVVTYTGLRLILPSEGGFSNPAGSELAEYLGNEVDEYLLIDELTSPAEEPGLTSLTDDEIISYLVDNGIDNNIIIDTF